jgi:hypothetical protein
MCMHHLIFSIIAVLALTFPLRAAEPSHRLLLADYSTKRIAILDPTGKPEWEYKIADLHDLQYLPTGNVLFQTDMQHLIEVNPRTNEVLWQ